MPVEHSPTTQRTTPPASPSPEEAEKQRKKELRSLRRFRTMSRNLMRADLNSIVGLHSENPVFPTDRTQDEVTQQIVHRAAIIREYSEKIGLLIEDDAEWAEEAPAAEETANECVRAIAAIEAANRRVRERSGVSVGDQVDHGQQIGTTVNSTPNSGSSGGSSNEAPADTGTGDRRHGVVSPVTNHQQTCSHEASTHLNRLTREYDMTPRKFSGDRLQYRTFVAEFDEYIGRRADVSALRKLLVLKKFLDGEPLIIVESLELTDSNYQVAFSLLEKNYSRVDSEKTKVISELRKLPSVPKPYDYNAISRLVTTVQSHISVLAVNGVSLSEFALTLLDSMEASLPARLRQDFLDHQQADEKYQRRVLADNTQDVGNPRASQQQLSMSAGATAAKEVEALISFLRQRLRDMERLKVENSATSLADKKTQENHRKGVKDAKKHPQSTIAAVARQSEAGASAGRESSKRPFKTKQCLFCRTHEHSSSKCNADLTVSQRLETLRKLDRCGKCFRPKHTVPSECEGPRSACSKCQSREHYSSMHVEKNPLAGATVSAVVGESAGVHDTLLWTACAFVVNAGRRIPIKIFIDPGSSLTIASPALCRQIPEPPIDWLDLSIQAFVSGHARRDVPVRSLRLSGPHDRSEIVIQACEHEIAVNPPNIAPSRIVDAIRRFDKRFPVADRSYLGEWKPKAPAILLGMDQSHKFMLDSCPEIVTDNLRAYQSHFGWVVGGPTSRKSSEPDTARKPARLVCCAAIRAHESTAQTSPTAAVQKLWTLEAIGITDSSTRQAMSADEESAMIQFRTSLSYANHRYTVGMPKRSSIDTLLNNHSGAAERLQRRLARLEKDPERYRKYHEELMKFVDRGFATEVINPPTLIATVADNSFYMPHHEVVTTSNSSEKWRIVFDCSARSRGGSALNDHLLAGPNLNPHLVTLLLNFRLHRVAVSADITQAYMQIELAPKDQRYFRFLWKFPGEDDLRTFQMQRVTWGAAPSGFLLAAVLREHFRREGPEAERRYGSRFYADDYLASYPDEKTATEVASDLRRILGTAGMTLAKWKSSSSDVMDSLVSEGVQESSIDVGQGGVFKVLGLSWSASEDIFRLTMPNLSSRISSADDRPNTKREMLSIIASVFDPLSWLAPFTLRGKRLIQKIWSAKLSWSDRIPCDSQRELSTWVGELEQFNKFQIPRQFVPGEKRPTAYRLHIFSDASPVGFAAVAYLEARYGDGASAFSLIMCRSRLAPLDSQTIPRLELLGALTATRLKTFLAERMEVEFEQVRFYTDSLITYYWVTSENPGSFKTFVFNRVREIQENSNRSEWYFCPGENNIADLATRGISANELIDNQAWWNGPSWLSSPDDQTPTSQPKSIAADALQVARSELRRVVAPIAVTPRLIDLNAYRSLSHAARVLAYSLRFISGVRREENVTTRELYRLAEMKLVHWTQLEYFREEILATRAGRCVPSTSKLASFSLFIDSDGLLRAKTRLTKGTRLTYDECNPIVIPGESRLAHLYIIDTHRINAHFGVATVLSYIRRRFWITRGRQVIRSLLRQCVVCKRQQGRPADQVEAPLPAFRIDWQTPFATTGVDFAGPFYTKYRTDTVKTYLMIFTCSTVRAVHLEAVPSMTAPQTGLAIRRFLSIYPACQRFVSDNGRSFVKASTDLKRLFNSVGHPETREILQQRLLEWDFQCARAAWRGGFFERLVGVVKSALHRTLGKSLIGFEEFRTILSELASVVNSRPLTPVSNDSDSITPITPAHFLRGGPPSFPLAGIAPIDKIASDECATARELQQGVKHRTTYFKNLSSRWFREYLLLLRSANFTRGREKNAIAVGDVCVLKDDNLPRVRWQLVRVKDQHPGRDGNVRTYTIQLANGRTTRRAAQVLYPLEISPGSLAAEESTE